MVSTRNYKVEYISNFDSIDTKAGTPPTETVTDITRYVMSLDKVLFADCFYKPNTAQLMLSAKAGRFITRDRALDSDTSETTPIIRHHDLLKITVYERGADKDNPADGESVSKYYYVAGILPQESASGDQLQIELAGQERYMERMYMSGHWFFEPVKSMVERIVDFYNASRGNKQPKLVIEDEDGNTTLDFPDYPLGTFDFGDGTSVLDGLRQMAAWLNRPDADQGANEMHSIVFEDVDVNEIRLRILPQGSNDSGTLETMSQIDPSDDSGTRQIRVVRTYEEYAGNMVVVRGQQGAGTWPVELAERTGRIEEYRNFPVWDADVEYAEDIYVTHNGTVYKSTADDNDTTPGTSNADWDSVTEADYVEDNIDEYSPWTRKENIFRTNTLRASTATLAPTSSDVASLDYPAMTDSNLVVRERSNRNPNGLWQDECMSRISVNITENTDGEITAGIPSQFLLDSKAYEGMKFLIIGSRTIFGQSSDKHGRSYANALVQVDRDGDWIVVKTPEEGDCIAVRSETKMYEYQRPFTAHFGREQRDEITTGDLEWRDISETPNGNHCFHYPASITNVTNSETKLDGASDTTGHHVNSAVQVVYEYRPADAVRTMFQSVFESLQRSLFGTEITLSNLLETVVGTISGATNAAVSGLLYSRDWFGIGWWLTIFEAPTPVRQIANSTGNRVGDIYANPVLDANNRNYTETGESGYTADDAEMLDTLDGFQFDLNLIVALVQQDDPITADHSNRPFQGALTIRATIYDTESNVWTADKEYRLVGETQRMTYLFSEFAIHKARAPIEWFPTIENIAPAELFSPEIPERRKIKRITLQIQDVYDEYGRYDPSRYANFLEKITTFLLDFKLRHIGWVDAFAFVKSPIAIATDEDNGNDVAKYPMQPPIINTSISNVAQLKKFARVQHDLTMHKNDAYTVEQPMRELDLNPGDAFYLTHKYLINEDEGSKTNTRKLVATDIEYADSKSSGLRRKIHCIREVGT